jgi:hypothetical protein
VLNKLSFHFGYANKNKEEAKLYFLFAYPFFCSYLYISLLLSNGTKFKFFSEEYELFPNILLDKTE